MGATSIEWTGHTVNPLRARLKSDPSKVGHYCEKVSPGCSACYASRFQARRGLPAFSGTHGRGLELVEPFLDVSKLREVLHRRKPTTYFWCDMTDMFGRWVSDEQIAACFGVMACTPWHTHQVLTKRAERLPLLSATIGLEPFEEMVASAAERLAEIVWDSRGSERHLYPPYAGDISRRRVWPGWPLPNVWLGVSVEDQQRADERIPHLLRAPAAVRFLSCEPLLGPLDIRHALEGRDGLGHCLVCAMPARCRCPTSFPSIDWVICGGESGPGARPMHPEWARSLRDQCVAASTPYFFKQWGAWAPYEAVGATEWHQTSAAGAELRGAVGGPSGEGKLGALFGGRSFETRYPWDDAQYPCMVRFGKKRAGRVLDRREWNEMPEAHQ